MISPAPAADLAAVKARQQAAWASGDYAVIGTTLTLTGELFCEAVALRPGRGCSTWRPATATSPSPPLAAGRM